MTENMTYASSYLNGIADTIRRIEEGVGSGLTLQESFNCIKRAFESTKASVGAKQ